MPDKPTEPNEGAGRLREVLLGYLQAAASIAVWPGTDSLTVENVLDYYPEAVAAGEVPDWQELLRRHPELATSLQAWMAAKDRWQSAFARRAEPERANHKVTKAQRQEENT